MISDKEDVLTGKIDSKKKLAHCIDAIYESCHVFPMNSGFSLKFTNLHET